MNSAAEIKAQAADVTPAKSIFNAAQGTAIDSLAIAKADESIAQEEGRRADAAAAQVAALPKGQRQGRLRHWRYRHLADAATWEGPLPAPHALDRHVALEPGVEHRGDRQIEGARPFGQGWSDVASQYWRQEFAFRGDFA